MDRQGVVGLVRLHEHPRPVAPERLLDYPPRIGEKLKAYEPRQVRRIIVGHYELRYEFAGAIIFILRLWRCRENRSFDSDD